MCSGTFSNFFHTREIPAGKMSVEKESASVLTLQKQVRLEYNNAPLGVKVYYFILLTEQLHFDRHTEQI